MAYLSRMWRLWGFLIFLIGLLVVFREVVLPFVFASLVAYILAPVIDRFEARLGRGGAVALTYLVLLALIGVFVGVLLPALSKDLARLRDGAPTLISRLNDEWLPRGEAWVEANFGELLPPKREESEAMGPKQERPVAQLVVRPQSGGQAVIDLADLKLHVHESASGGYIIEPQLQRPVEPGLLQVDLRALLSKKGGEWTLYFGEWLQSVIRGIAQFLTKFVVTFMIAAFLLIDLSRVRRFLRSLVPLDFRGSFDEIMRGVDAGMSGVIRGQAMICLINGVLTYVGMLMIGVKYSLLLGILATVFSLVPIFGTIISSAPILLMALLSTETGISAGKCLAMLAWITGIHLVEANYLNPKVLGGTAHIHPVIVVFALLAGEHVYGLTGALLAVPVASMIQTVFMYLRRNASTFAQGEWSSVVMTREDFDPAAAGPLAMHRSVADLPSSPRASGASCSDLKGDDSTTDPASHS